MTHEFPPMVRLSTALGGVIAAFTTAGAEVAAGSPPAAAFGWSMLAGIAGAGVTYGVTTAKVNSAHAKIAAEKADRIAAIADLKGDVNRGFDRMEEQLRDQTRTVMEALSRNFKS